MPQPRPHAVAGAAVLLLAACAVPVPDVTPTAPGTPITFAPRAPVPTATGGPTLLPLPGVTPTAAASPSARPTRTPSAPAAGTPADPDVAARQLALGLDVVTKPVALRRARALRVATPAPMTGYSRDQFRHWLDASTWGWPVAPSDECTSRSAALVRDGSGVRTTSSCGITGGRWLDPYTATWVASRTKVDVDHIVPLAAAWRGGAGGWTPLRRAQFANDPLVLVTVGSSVNRAKGDRTADLWKPPNKAAWCLYAQRYTAVKTSYGLSVTAAEQAALVSMLGTCPR